MAIFLCIKCTGRFFDDGRNSLWKDLANFDDPEEVIVHIQDPLTPSEGHGKQQFMVAD
jgi:hypothetical protein